MASYLIARYNLTLKELYDGYKEQVPEQLTGTLEKNRKRILTFVLPLVRKAYREGVAFAQAVAKYEYMMEVKAGNKISPAIKNQILNEFILHVKDAEAVYKLKLMQRASFKKLKKIKKEEGEGQNIIRWEYERAIAKAVNRVIILAGQVAEKQVYKEL